MSDKQTEPSGGISIGDIYFVLFRHKWKILFFSTLGLVAAATILLVKPAPYQSTTEIEIKFLQEKPGAGIGGDPTPRPLDQRPESIFSTEISYLRSRDVAMAVVTNLGAERILAKLGGGSNFDQAVDAIRYNVIVEPPSRNNVLNIVFQHPDRDLVADALNEVLHAYYNKHANMHQGISFDPKALLKRTNELSLAVDAAEEKLKAEKEAAQVSSLDEEKKFASDQLGEAMTKLLEAEGELARHRTMIAKLSPATQATGSNSAPAETVEVVPQAVVEEYARAIRQLELRTREFEAVEFTYVEGSSYYQEPKKRMEDARRAKEQLEKEHSGLLGLATSAAVHTAQASPPAMDLSMESATVVSLEATTNFWNVKVASLRQDLRRIEQHEGTIRDLELQITHLKESLNSWLSQAEQNSINNDLRAGNEQRDIKVVQFPTPAVKKWSKTFQNKVAMVAAGGIGFGLALAFLIELVLDRSVKRPVEIENKLRLPLMISIPDINRNGHRRRVPAGGTLAITNGSDGGGPDQVEVEPWDKRHLLHRFYGGLRDRLIVYFEVRNLVHKPKLVAVTSCNQGAGVSTIAAGLAASLSQTGDGNVLLVDMNEEQGVAQQFHKGSPGCGLDVALEAETMKTALVEGNLYVATDRMPGGKIQRVPHGRLANLMPKLKASDYDYIIFDMPAVTQTSMTARLSGLMDMVLLVIESEKTNQDVVKRAVALLGESKATVSTVLNKTRSYVPAQLHQETLSDD